MLGLATWLVAIKHGYPAEPFPGWRVVGKTAMRAIPGFFTAVIIVGGVLSGVFTVTESGAIGVAYALIITGFVYRYMLAFYRVPDALAGMITSITDNPIMVLLLINVMLLIAGMIMDMAALILICTPIFLPLAVQFGMDPIQFGMVLMMNLGLGLCTPPVGSCLFVGCAIGGVKIEKAVMTIWPFYLAILTALLLTTYVPAVSLTLPNLVFGGS